jgi:type 2A phosphatase activator TIP41
MPFGRRSGGDEADRQRVMPHSFFILYRLFLRVDNVLFRIYDVRIYHKFGSGEVIKESLGMEADYDTIKSVSLPWFLPAAT